ncbi:fibronectin type III-like domain-contianing protein, partial [Klebsiella pneumoniae]|nr:fibronectin type III-like domain-contianing protein [Klebsiella pneumoniae]
RDGKETVQLYVGDDKCSVVRPLKELKAFQKVAVKAGETVSAKMTISRQDLMFWDETTGGWRLEPGTFTLYVGA